jgi:hypothetical protein
MGSLSGYVDRFTMQAMICKAVVISQSDKGPKTKSRARDCRFFRLCCYNFARTICLYVFESVKSPG